MAVFFEHRLREEGQGTDWRRRGRAEVRASSCSCRATDCSASRSSCSSSLPAGPIPHFFARAEAFARCNELRRLFEATAFLSVTELRESGCGRRIQIYPSGCGD